MIFKVVWISPGIGSQANFECVTLEPHPPDKGFRCVKIICALGLFQKGDKYNLPFVCVGRSEEETQLELIGEGVVFRAGKQGSVIRAVLAKFPDGLKNKEVARLTGLTKSQVAKHYANFPQFYQKVGYAKRKLKQQEPRLADVS